MANPLVKIHHGLRLQLLFSSLTGTSDAEVIQTPAHLVKGRGQKAKMDCLPHKGHPVVYWYQHIQNEEFKCLIYFQNEDVLDQIELVKKRFSANCSSNSHCSLEIRSSEPGDSALYFCASSQSTALKWQFLLVQKLTMDPAQEAGDALGWKEVTEMNWS